LRHGEDYKTIVKLSTEEKATRDLQQQIEHVLKNGAQSGQGRANAAVKTALAAMMQSASQATAVVNTPHQGAERCSRKQMLMLIPRFHRPRRCATRRWAWCGDGCSGYAVMSSLTAFECPLAGGSGAASAAIGVGAAAHCGRRSDNHALAETISASALRQDCQGLHHQKANAFVRLLAWSSSNINRWLQQQQQ
jgi:hypothetical protein